MSMNKDASRGAISRRKFISRVEFPPMIWLVVVWILFLVLSNGTFGSAYNIKLIAGQVPINGIMSIGLFLIILVGGIDISVGSALAFHAVLIGYMFDVNLPFAFVIIIIPVIGCLLGYGIGSLVTRIKIPELIATLAAQYIIRGVAIVIGQKPYAKFPAEMEALGKGTVGDVPISAILFIVIALIIGVLLHKTNFGKKVYAVGGNMEAASLAGIDVPRVRRQLFMIEGVLVGFAAFLYVSTYGNVQANWIGVETINTLLAAVLIGGVNMDGGRGTVLGTCLGALLMTVIGNGMILIKLNEYWVTAVTGILILGALVIQYMQQQSLRTSRRIRLEKVQ